MFKLFLRLFGIKVRTLTLEEAKRELGDVWRD